MRDIAPSPPAVVRNETATIQALFQKHVVPTYARFEVAFSHGQGCYLWDVTGKRYLDMGGGIAVCSLGHAHPAISEALAAQSRRLVHVSNLYYHEPQGRLAQQLAGLIGPGKCFFCNSGAEANEGLFKLARKFGHDEGRFEILTAANSFHGRTLAGIAATGQEKVKKGFEPLVTGFRHVPFNDVEAARAAISPATVAILVEGVQGEGGVLPATPEYLLGLRRLCDEKKLLLLMDGVQCGHFRTGRFQSYQRILEDCSSRREEAHSSHLNSSQSLLTSAATEFVPDGIAMAKSLGGGFPIGAIWIREPYADLLGPGTHATTFGGTPLGCAVALKILEVIQQEKLDENARAMGEFLKRELQRLAREHSQILSAVRGLGLMIGIELAQNIPALAGNQNQSASVQMVNRLHAAGLMTIPAGNQVIRLLPPLNLRQGEAEEALKILESVVRDLAA